MQMLLFPVPEVGLIVLFAVFVILTGRKTP